MITTGAKFYFGLGFLLLVAAVLYGWTSGGVDWGLFPGHMGDLYFQLLGALTMGYKGGVGDHVGYGILLGGSAVSTTMGAFMIAFRDSEAKAVAEVAGLPDAPPLIVIFGASRAASMSATQTKKPGIIVSTAPLDARWSI